MCNAVRENPERVEFLGYDPNRIRLLAFTISAGFAGVAGALAAIDFEIVNSAYIGAAQSSLVLLAAFIGGARYFAGPVVGAILVVYLQNTLSDHTEIWQLYFGLLFIGMVSFAPGGILGLVALHLPLARAGRLHRLLPGYAIAAPAAGAAIGAAIMLIELTYHLLAHAADGPQMTLAGRAVDASDPVLWIVAAILLAAGLLALRAAAPPHNPRVRGMTPPAIALRGLVKRFGPTEIIRGLDLEVASGERHAVIGPNGAGKSTTFHLISGRLAASAGRSAWTARTSPACPPTSSPAAASPAASR